MKVLIISYHHNDKNSIGSVRTSLIEKLLPKYGIEVSVLTSGFHSEQILFDKNTISVRSNEFVKNKFQLMKRKLKNIFNWLGKFDDSPTEWENIITTRFDDIIKLSDPDIILCSYPPMWAIRLGLNLSKLANLPLITDFRDSFLINPIETGLNNKNSKKHEYYEKIELLAKERSKIILCASNDIYDSFTFKNNLKNVMVLYNSFEESVHNSDQIYFDKNVINIVHTGRLSLSEKGTSILGLVAGLLKTLQKEPNLSNILKFHFVGDLSLFEKVLLWPFKLIGLVKIWGCVDREVSLNMQKSADILLLITKPMAKNAISGKLIEYLKQNKPILGLTSGSEAEIILNKSKLGILAAPDNSQEISNQIFSIINFGYKYINPDIEYINNFRAPILIGKLSEALKKIISMNAENYSIINFERIK